MSYTILLDHLLIKDKVEKLFNHNTRHRKRVILINYLDEILATMLPDVQNVKIYCYPQPGNIDPYALENLQKKGAKIYLTNPINTNMFYVEHEGIILGSANYNYTKYVMECYDKVKDIMIFIHDWSSIDVDTLIYSLDVDIMSQNDLVRLKEEHHIFWRTFDGFDALIKSLVNTKNYIDSIEENTKTGYKINDLFNMIKDFLLVKKEQKHPSMVVEDMATSNIKYGIKDVGGKIANKPNMNIYCMSKDDLYEMLSKQLQVNKLKTNKKNLH